MPADSGPDEALELSGKVVDGWNTIILQVHSFSLEKANPAIALLMGLQVMWQAE
jgi:hypothetical protein